MNIYIFLHPDPPILSGLKYAHSLTLQKQIHNKHIYVLLWQSNALTDCQGVLKWTSLSRSPVLATRCHQQGVPVHWGPMSGVEGFGVGGGSVQWCPLSGGEGTMYNEVQCIMGNCHMTLLCSHGQTDTTENITFPHFRWRAVRLRYPHLPDYRPQFHFQPQKRSTQYLIVQQFIDCTFLISLC